MKKRISRIIVILIIVITTISYISKTSPIEATNQASMQTASNETLQTAQEQSQAQQEGNENAEEAEYEIQPQVGFDLSIRTFVTNINGRELVNEEGKYTREPNIELKSLNTGKSTTAEYKAQKSPVRVAEGDIVIYTIRIYNEGGKSGYASSVTDYLPPQLEFVMNDEENFNAQYGWRIDPTFRKATTTLLERPTIDPEDTLIKAFDGETLDYKELKIKCKVVSQNYIEKIITNIVEITGCKDNNGNEIIDRDSSKENLMQQNQITDETLPDYKGSKTNKSVLVDSNYFYKGTEDDDDFEKIILEEFDLSLKQFITKVNEEEITNRAPTFKEKYNYEQNKEPVEVNTNDIVEYTIRIYNEGDIAGYAKEIKNNIPEGLKFLSDNIINQDFGWVMVDENGEETKNEDVAVEIKTNYLSKEEELKKERNNLITEFNNTKEAPDYREIKVVFEVTNQNGTIANTSQISASTDENGRYVEDRDSIANQWNEGEDDQDTEQIKKKHFELGIIKAINQATSQTQEQEQQEQTQNQVETEINTQQETRKTTPDIKQFLFSIGALPIM